ncbi:MAG: twin-arginine translocase TatA/TatE family subunit [bacterium]|nr:twin-arginine translocase TatA/TatE family subunit [bacterium]
MGPTELTLIVLALLLLFGGKKIPELAKGLGSGIREFQHGLKESQGGKPDSGKDALEADDSKDNS